MKKTIIIRFLEKLELFLYHRANAIIAVTKSFKKDLIDRGISASKIHVVQNGVDLLFYKPTARKSPMYAEKYKLHGKFVIGYIGTHGTAHALDNVVEAAKLLETEESIRFLFAGGGSERQRIKSLAMDCKNIVFRQPKIICPAFEACEVALIHLKC